MSNLYNTLVQILHTLVTQLPSCRPVIVGGSVRDACDMQDHDSQPKEILHYIMQNDTDLDVEIFRVYPYEVEQVLSKAGIPYKLVGDKFPVYVVGSDKIQLAFPRREAKTGAGHSDFNYTLDPGMSYMTAASRRDFTVNSLGYDWLENQLMDPWHGRIALRKRILEPVSGKFREDALRILRAFRFIASHGFKPSGNLVAMSSFMIDELRGYPRERHIDEWVKFMLRGKGVNIPAAFDFLIQTGAIDIYPELNSIRGVVQDKNHHPEGCVFTHTKHCLAHFFDKVRGGLLDDHERIVIGFAVLTHDFGKATTTLIDRDQGKVTAIGHEDSPSARRFLGRLFDPKDARIDQIEDLVKSHMRPVNLYNLREQISDSAIRRLKLAVRGRLDRLTRVVECDQSGRPPKEPNLAAISWLLDKADKLGLANTDNIKQIIQGRHLIELGKKPGREFGVIIDQMFQLQLEGKFATVEEGKALIAAGDAALQGGGS